MKFSLKTPSAILCALVLLCLLTNLSVQAQINSFPYEDDFENDNGGWTAKGTNSSWEWGTPDGTIIDQANSGTKAWVTNLDGVYNNNELSWIESPEFDFTNLNNPAISFELWWDAEYTVDGAVFQVSLDAGATWQRVGSHPDTNWYNYQYIFAVPDLHGFTGDDSGGSSEGWLSVGHTLYNLSGESSVIFRLLFASDSSVVVEGFGFDDVKIEDVECKSAGENGTLETCGGVDEIDLFYALEGSPDEGGTWTYPSTEFGNYIYTHEATMFCDEQTAIVVVNELPLAYAGEGTDAPVLATLEVVDLNTMLKSDPVTGKKPDTGGKWKDKDTGAEIPLGTIDFTNAKAGSYTRSFGYEVEGNCGSEDESIVEFEFDVPFNPGADGELLICEGYTPTESELFGALGGNPDDDGYWTQDFNDPLLYIYEVTDGSTAEVTLVVDVALSPGLAGTLEIAMGATVTEAQLFEALGGTPDEGGTWTTPLAGAGVYTYTHAATLCHVASSATVTVTESTLSATDVAHLGLEIFPNPVGEQLFIKGAVGLIDQIEIYSIHGQLLREVQSNFKRIDVATLQPAIYYIKVFSEKGVGTYKMLKQ